MSADPAEKGDASAAPFHSTVTVSIVKKDGFVPVRRLSESPWLGAGVAVLAAAAALLVKVNPTDWVRLDSRPA